MALEGLIALFRRCETLLRWPSQRILNELVLLPKDGGGHRVIALVHSLVRVWSRMRKDLSATWLAEHPSPLMFGTAGPGKTSSDSAFQHNLHAETETLLGGHSVTVLYDAYKCFELVKPAALIEEARALCYPLRLLWMLLAYFAEPRYLRAYGC